MTDNVTFTKEQSNAAINAAKAAVASDKATGTLENRAAELVKAGITVEDISRDGRFLNEFQRIMAETALTAKQFATWGDDSLAQGKVVNGKRVDSERGTLVKRVNSLIRNVRNKMKEPAKTGARSTSTPTEKFFKVLDDYVERFGKDNASDVFDFDPQTARVAFVKLIKELK